MLKNRLTVYHGDRDNAGSLLERLVEPGSGDACL